MFYAIDFDTRRVESKSEDNELLATYILDNDLSLVIALIGNADELCLEFSMKEMKEIFINLKCKSRLFKDPTAYEKEEDVADAIFETLEEQQDNFPNFTKALGKKLLKEASKETKPTSKSSTKPKAKSTISFRAKDLEGMTFVVTDKPTRPGTAFHVLSTIIEENFEQATFDELIKGFMENYEPTRTAKVVDDKCARSYLKDAFKGGYIEETL